MSESLNSTRVGSSPLARGLRLRAVPRGLRLGIIPARAGFTEARGITEHPSEDHPRSRGVYMETEGKNFLQRGSSPLARGLPHESDVEGI